MKLLRIDDDQDSAFLWAGKPYEKLSSFWLSVFDDDNDGDDDDDGRERKRQEGRSKFYILLCRVVEGRSPLKPRSTVGELQQFDSPCAECPKFTGASKTERMAHLRASHQVSPCQSICAAPILNCTGILQEVAEAQQ